MNNHPIYLVDDDDDDNEIVQIIWDELGLTNELVFFKDGISLIESLRDNSTIPFIIICDLNLPTLDGFEIRKKLANDPLTRYKTVPFIFWSNSVSQIQIKHAYDIGAHGMFVKGSTIDEIKTTFTRIVEYWQSSQKPE